MSQWNMGATPDPETGVREFEMRVTTDDSVGSMNGTAIFRGVTFHVAGELAASGSVPARAYSAFYLGGSDQQTAPKFVGMTGTMEGPGGSPQPIQLNLVQTDSEDGLQYGYNAKLTPL